MLNNDGQFEEKFEPALAFSQSRERETNTKYVHLSILPSSNLFRLRNTFGDPIPNGCWLSLQKQR